MATDFVAYAIFPQPGQSTLFEGFVLRGSATPDIAAILPEPDRTTKERGNPRRETHVTPSSAHRTSGARRAVFSPAFRGVGFERIAWPWYL